MHSLAVRQEAVSSRQEAGGNRLEAVSPKPSTLNPKPYSLPPMAAASRFGRYGPMQPQAVRQPDVTGQSYQEQARKAREMLRSLAPEKELELIEFRQGLNLFEALLVAQRENLLIVPNNIHDRILNETINIELLKQPYKCRVWTGTLIIYGAPDKKLGKEVVFSYDNNGVQYSVSFQIPKQFQEKTNCALVIEHPDFEIRRISKDLDVLEDTSRVRVRRTRDRGHGPRDFELISLGNNNYEIKPLGEIRLLENFPTKADCWYNPDPETKIPQGEPVKESKDARYLWRSHKAYLGALGRGNGWYVDDGKRYIGADGDWSFDSVVAFVPLVVAPEKSDSHG